MNPQYILINGEVAQVTYSQQQQGGGGKGGSQPKYVAPPPPPPPPPPAAPITPASLQPASVNESGTSDVASPANGKKSLRIDLGGASASSGYSTGLGIGG